MARRALIVAVLGSGVAFLDGTIVNVALPAIGRDLDAGLDQAGLGQRCLFPSANVVEEMPET